MNRLKTSDITAANHVEVYDYYQSTKQHKVLPIVADHITAAIFHPEVVVPETTEEYIHQRFESGQPLIMVANHVRYNDHNVVSSAIHQVPLLSELIVGNTFIFAKAPYFQNTFSRWHNELSNVIPVFREVDIAKETGNKAVSKMEVGRPANALVDLSLKRLALGQNLFLFPEGTRNRNNWGKLLPIEAGIGHIAFKAWHRDLDVGIIPVGLAYDRSSRFDVLKPVVQFGEPITKKSGMKPNLITDLVKLSLQYCVDLAYSEIGNRPQR